MRPWTTPFRRAQVLLAICSFFVLGLTASMPTEVRSQVRRDRPGTQTETGSQPQTWTGPQAVQVLKDSGTYESLKEAASKVIAPKNGETPSSNLFNGGQYEEVTLTAGDGGANDFLGFSVAVSGNTAVVGSGYFGKGITQGAVYVFVRSGSTWTQQAKLIASDGGSEDSFGFSVSISEDTIAVGAPFADIGGNYNQGAVYVYVRSGDTWTEQVKLTAADGYSYDDFGTAVSFNGETLTVGAPFADDMIFCEGSDGSLCLGESATDVGAAYVFVRSGTVWSQQQKLMKPGPAGYDLFGYNVATSGDTVAIFSCNGCDYGPSSSPGSVYIYTRSGTVWTGEAVLAASDGTPFDYFGYGLALEGDTALIGAPCATVSGGPECAGAAYFFTRAGTTWTQGQKFVSPTPAEDGYFGIDVSLSGDSAVVAQPGDAFGGSGYGYGSVLTYKRSGSTWTAKYRLFASDRAGYDFFGYSAAVDGDTVIVGVPYDDVSSPMVGANGAEPTPNYDQGSARIFQTKVDITKQVSDDGATSDWFGRSVAISGDTAVVGAPLDDIGSNVNQGSAYVFIRIGSVWVQQAKLVSGDGGAGDNFGWSVSVDGDTALVGAPLDDIATVSDQGGASSGLPTMDEGSAYAFKRTAGVWTQQQKLTSGAGSSAGSHFGWSVAVSGDRAIVGEPLFMNSGALSFFARSGSTWSTSNFAVCGATNCLGGWSVALSGTTGIVGSPGIYDGAGAANIILISSGGLDFPPINPPDGAVGDNYGWSVSISGGTAVVGAPNHDLSASVCAGYSAGCAGSSLGPEAATPINQGAAYVWTGSGGTWNLLQELTASDNGNNDQFGYTVSVSGNNLLIGAYGDDVGNNADQGSAYMFTRSGTNWTQQRKLSDPDGAAGDGFGWAVGVASYTAVVGAWADDVDGGIITPGLGPNQGSVSFFNWVPLVPTAAGARLSGRVLTPENRGLSGATVVLTDSSGKDLTVQTGTFGNFSFENLPAGESFVITVRSKRYQYSPQLVELASDLDGLRLQPDGGGGR